MWCFRFEVVASVVAVCIGIVSTGTIKSNTPDYLCKEVHDKTHDLAKKIQQSADVSDENLSRVLNGDGHKSMVDMAAYYYGLWRNNLISEGFLIDSLSDVSEAISQWKKENTRRAHELYKILNTADSSRQSVPCESIANKWVKSTQTLLKSLNVWEEDLTTVSSGMSKLPSLLQAELEERRKMKKADKKTENISFRFPELETVIGAENLRSAGIPEDVIRGTVEPNEKEKLKITEVYYDELIKAVEKVQYNVLPSTLGFPVTEVQKQISSVLDALKNTEGRASISYAVIPRVRAL